MSSPKFERAKRLNPGLARLLDRLISYIKLQQVDKQAFILPKLASAALGLNDGEAFVLLELLVDAGVLGRAYNIYCKVSDRLLATVHSEAGLKNVPYCDDCDRDHLTSELRLEVAFERAKGSERFWDVG